MSVRAPIGLWGVNTPPPYQNTPQLLVTEFNRIRQAGFERIHSEQFGGDVTPSPGPGNSDLEVLAFLDAADRAGLKVLFKLPSQTIQSPSLFPQLVARVNLVKGHNALWKYLLFDEPDLAAWRFAVDGTVPPVQPAQLLAAYNQVKMADSSHPVVWNSAETFDSTWPIAYKDTFDELIHIYLSIGFGNPVTDPLLAFTFYQTALNFLAPYSKPLGMGIQTFNLANDNVICQNPANCVFAHYPTLQEMYNLAQAAITQALGPTQAPISNPTALQAGLWWVTYRFGNPKGGGGDDVSLEGNPTQWSTIASALSQTTTLLSRYPGVPQQPSTPPIQYPGPGTGPQSAATTTASLTLAPTKTTTKQISSYTFSAISAQGRQQRILSLPVDTLARLVRLRTSPQSNLKIYAFKFDFLAEPSDPTRFQTEWDSIGYMWDKILEAVPIEIDTFGSAVSVYVQRNGSTASADTFPFTITVTGRQIVPLYLPRGTLGKTFRLVFESPTATRFKYYKHQWKVKPEPPDTTLIDSYETDMGYDRYKFLRRAWLTGKGSNVTMVVLGDGTQQFTSTFSFPVGVQGGWTKPLPIVFSAGIRAKLFRYIFTAPSAAKIYPDLSEVEWKPLGSDRGYARSKMITQVVRELQ